jgi:hypothetical protein
LSREAANSEAETRVDVDSAVELDRPCDGEADAGGSLSGRYWGIVRENARVVAAVDGYGRRTRCGRFLELDVDTVCRQRRAVVVHAVRDVAIIVS